MSNRLPNPNSSAAKSRWVHEAMTPIAEEKHQQADLLQHSRTLRDLPSTVPQGARDVAQLTAVRCYQRKKLPEVMDALERLSKAEDWSHPFLVMDSDVFDWHTAPIREYTSFEDFYRRELESVWGKWADLKTAWSDLVAHRINVEEFEDRTALRDKPGRPTNTERDAKRNDGNNIIHPRGTNSPYIRARLKRDSQDEELPQVERERKAELLVKVERGEISSHAAAIEAGIRQRMISHQPTVACFLRAATRWLSADERQQLAEALVKGKS
jgi:hypothetical protein